jgi:hypothetical protein
MCDKVPLHLVLLQNVATLMLRYVMLHFVTFPLCYATFCSSILPSMKFYINQPSSNLSCKSATLDSVWQEGIQYNLHTVDKVLASKLSGIAAPQVQEVKTKNI